MWDVVSWAGIEPGPQALGARSLNCCATREVPTTLFLIPLFYFLCSTFHFLKLCVNLFTYLFCFSQLENKLCGEDLTHLLHKCSLSSASVGFAWQIQRTNCIRYSMPFCTRNLNIHRFWYLQRLLEPIHHGHRGTAVFPGCIEWCLTHHMHSKNIFWIDETWTAVISSLPAFNIPHPDPSIILHSSFPKALKLIILLPLWMAYNNLNNEVKMTENGLPDSFYMVLFIHIWVGVCVCIL